MATLPAEAQSTDFETVIGLEVHVQLKTDSKLFSQAPNQFGENPNTNVTPVCLGLPGVLPVLNGKALEYAIQIGLALNCEIATLTKFDRKQYFYPDLPKAYQISQYDKPVCGTGHITLSNGRTITINRAHLEEDAGKLVHSGAAGLHGSDYSLVDLNRAGTPLVEIVTNPDFRTAEEAREYVMTLRNIVRYLGVCDGNMEEGSLRCDANVSIRPRGSETLGTKAEIKNLNSFKSVQRAIEVEIQRQVEVIRRGDAVVQETRLWNEGTQTTHSMRSKEEAHDYRYFPDPDIPPVEIDSQWVEQLRASLPELPEQRKDRLVSEFNLPEYDADLLVDNLELGQFFLNSAQHSKHYKALSNWLQGDISGWLNTEKKSLAETCLTPKALAQLVELIEKDTISSAIAKKMLPDLLSQDKMPQELIEEQGLAQISDEGSLRPIIEKIMADNPDNVAAYRAGREKVIGFFVGQVMRETQGKANPALINQLLKEMLKRE